MTVCEFKKLVIGDELFVDGMLATVTDVSEDDTLRCVSVSYFDDHSCVRREETFSVYIENDENFAPNYRVFSRLTAFHGIYDIGGI